MSQAGDAEKLLRCMQVIILEIIVNGIEAKGSGINDVIDVIDPDPEIEHNPCTQKVHPNPSKWRKWARCGQIVLSIEAVQS